MFFVDSLVSKYDFVDQFMNVTLVFSMLESHIYRPLFRHFRFGQLIWFGPLRTLRRPYQILHMHKFGRVSKDEC